jgi:hypothetical protein
MTFNGYCSHIGIIKVFHHSLRLNMILSFVMLFSSAHAPCASEPIERLTSNLAQFDSFMPIKFSVIDMDGRIRVAIKRPEYSVTPADNVKLNGIKIGEKLIGVDGVLVNDSYFTYARVCTAGANFAANKHEAIDNFTAWTDSLANIPLKDFRTFLLEKDNSQVRYNVPFPWYQNSFLHLLLLFNQT